MHKVLSAEEAKENDIYTIKNFVPSIELMERAALKLFDYLSENYDKSHYFLILVGKGNNAGDGYALGRILLSNGYDVDILALEKPKSEEAIINAKKYNKKCINEINIKEKTIVIDAIFGNGFKGDVPSLYFGLIKKINESEVERIAIDVPTGIDGVGKVNNIAFKADVTLGIASYKLSYFLNDAKDYVGKLVILDIGLSLLKKNYIEILEENDFQNLFPIRKSNVNKGCFGKVTFLGGNKLTPGALNISKKAFLALHFGAGYAEVAFTSSLKEIYEEGNDEVIYKELSSNKDGSIKFKEEEIETLLSSRSITIGMGIGVSLDVYKIISYLLKNYKNNLIIDADGLNSLAKYGIDILKEHQCEVILTPHLKEFSRLINKDIEEIKRNRIELAEEFVNKYSVNLLLKDNVSLIINKDKKYLNINGNAALAKGGSGDALSGILGGMLYSKENLLERVAFSSFLLGKAADLSFLKRNEYTLTITDIINTLDELISSWR